MNTNKTCERELINQCFCEGPIEEYRRLEEREANFGKALKNRNMYSFNVEFRGSRAVTQADLAVAREKAAARRRRLLRNWEGQLICASMNMPGAYKQFPLAALCFSECRRAVEMTMEASGIKLVPQDFVKHDSAGDVAYYLVDGSPAEIKRLLCEIEDTHLLGRLFNLDLYMGSEDAWKVSRSEIGADNRLCLLCENDAVSCIHARRHSIDELVNHSLNMMWAWVSRHLTDKINTTATKALCGELATTPKPGLVDRSNNGAHSDMDYFTFIDSISELLPYFQECALAGFNGAAAAINSSLFGSCGGHIDPPALLKSVRRAGDLAQVKMLRATGGVNTHKGLIFSLGIMCAAYGWLMRSKTVFTLGELFDFCSDVAAPAMDDLSAVTVDGARTNGEKAFAQYGFTGIRGEASNGFMSVRKHGLPTLRLMLERGHSMNDAGVAAFIALLSHVDDTTILHRSDAKTLGDIQGAAAGFMAANPAMSDIRKWAAETDAQFIKRNISAGGCADLLAITFFVWYLL